MSWSPTRYLLVVTSVMGAVGMAAAQSAVSPLYTDAKVIWPQLTSAVDSPRSSRNPGYAVAGKVIWPQSQLGVRTPQTALVGAKRADAHMHQLITRASLQHDVDARLIHAVISAESTYKIEAVSPKGAVGLMQVMPATAKGLGVRATREQSVAELLTDPWVNINAGTRYLADMLGQFARVDLALAAYNAGPGAVRKAGNQIPRYAETQDYVRKVVRNYRALGGGART